MDKTIELIVVAMVIIVASSILIFLTQNQVGGFGDFADGQQNDAKCELWKETCNDKYETEGCGEGAQLPQSCPNEGSTEETDSEDVDSQDSGSQESGGIDCSDPGNAGKEEC